MKTIIVIPRELSSGRKFLNGFSVPAFFVKGNSLNVFRYRVPVNNTTEAINNKFKNNETGELLKKSNQRNNRHNRYQKKYSQKLK